MSGRIGQPVGQVRFTNVAVVRLKKHGKRFEVASYRNKVLSWRNKTEADVNEVLQVPTVFTNVSRGVHASGKELMDAFGTSDHLKVAQLILDTGEVEVSDKERAALLESLFRDIATIIADKCVNPTTSRPYPVTLIATALKEAHFSVAPGKSAKSQALKAIGLLQKSGIPLERAKMRVRITCDAPADAAALRSTLAAMHVTPDVDTGAATAAAASSSSSSSSSSAPADTGDDAEGPMEPLATTTIEATIDPGHYRALEEAVARTGTASLAVLSLSAHTDAGGAGAAASSTAGGTRRAAAGSDDDSDSDEEGDPATTTTTTAAAPTKPAGATGGAGTGGDAAAAAASSTSALLSSADVTAASAAGTGMAVRRVTVPGARSLTCNSCGGIAFDTAAAHRDHFRSDLHRANLKLKTRGKPPMTADGFDALTAKERDEILSALE